MSMTRRFPRLLYGLESIRYRISAVDKMWIKQGAQRLFVSFALYQPKNRAGIGGHPYMMVVRYCEHGRLGHRAIVYIHLSPNHGFAVREIGALEDLEFSGDGNLGRIARRFDGDYDRATFVEWSDIDRGAIALAENHTRARLPEHHLEHR